MVPDILTQPQPDAESIADVVRERLAALTCRNRPSTVAELDEIAQLVRLLSGHIVFIQEVRRAQP